MMLGRGERGRSAVQIAGERAHVDHGAAAFLEGLQQFQGAFAHGHKLRNNNDLVGHLPHLQGAVFCLDLLTGQQRFRQQIEIMEPK